MFIYSAFPGLFCQSASGLGPWDCHVETLLAGKILAATGPLSGHRCRGIRSVPGNWATHEARPRNFVQSVFRKSGHALHESYPMQVFGPVARTPMADFPGGPGDSDAHCVRHFQRGGGLDRPTIPAVPGASDPNRLEVPMLNDLRLRCDLASLFRHQRTA